MSAAPCGCDLRERAKTETDPRAAAVIDAEGLRAQQLWRCPRVCPRVEGELAPACVSTLAAVHRLVGIDPAAGDLVELTTCPGWYARQPEAYEVARLLPWLEKGALGLRVPYPTAALCDALDVTTEALARREAEDLRRVREKSESAR